MPESETHKAVKTRAAGKTGKTEVALPSGRKLDAATGKYAVEVELSGSTRRLKTAASRLKASGKPGRVLVVPQKDISKATDAMNTVGTRGTVRNLTGSKRVSVAPSRPSRASSGRPSER